MGAACRRCLCFRYPANSSSAWPSARSLCWCRELCYFCCLCTAVSHTLVSIIPFGSRPPSTVPIPPCGERARLSCNQRSCSRRAPNRAEKGCCHGRGADLIFPQVEAGQCIVVLLSGRPRPGLRATFAAGRVEVHAGPCWDRELLGTGLAGMVGSVMVPSAVAWDGLGSRSQKSCPQCLRPAGTILVALLSYPVQTCGGVSDGIVSPSHAFSSSPPPCIVLPLPSALLFPSCSPCALLADCHAATAASALLTGPVDWPCRYPLWVVLLPGPVVIRAAAAR